MKRIDNFTQSWIYRHMTDQHYNNQNAFFYIHSTNSTPPGS